MPDNDPLESLDNFPEGLHVDSLPASEVRRRGDRMRRRNTALATVGGVVAAAVFIGTPVALMSGNDKDTVDPAPSPPTPSVTEDAPARMADRDPGRVPAGRRRSRRPTGSTARRPRSSPAPPPSPTSRLCGTNWPSRARSTLAASATPVRARTSDRLVLLQEDDRCHRPHWPRRGQGSRPAPTSRRGVTTSISRPHWSISTSARRSRGDRSAGAVRRRAAQRPDRHRGGTQRQRAVRGDVVRLRGRRRGRGVRDRAAPRARGRPLGAMCVFSADPCSTTEVTPDSDTSSSPPGRERNGRDPGRLPARRGHGRERRGERHRGPRAGRRGRPRWSTSAAPTCGRRAASSSGWPPARPASSTSRPASW